jgi:hypothetical protein
MIDGKTHVPNVAIFNQQSEISNAFPKRLVRSGRASADYNKARHSSSAAFLVVNGKLSEAIEVDSGSLAVFSFVYGTPQGSHHSLLGHHRG